MGLISRSSDSRAHEFAFLHKKLSGMLTLVCTALHHTHYWVKKKKKSSSIISTRIGFSTHLVMNCHCLRLLSVCLVGCMAIPACASLCGRGVAKINKDGAKETTPMGKNTCLWYILLFLLLLLYFLSFFFFLFVSGVESIYRAVPQKEKQVFKKGNWKTEGRNLSYTKVCIQSHLTIFILFITSEEFNLSFADVHTTVKRQSQICYVHYASQALPYECYLTCTSVWFQKRKKERNSNGFLNYSFQKHDFPPPKHTNI